ncbi:putative GEM-like protein 1-like [Capsicum annuum]|nr:putative GEM-like protein 1-like [Capsicum annuum]KAF3619647.1 putative GEM-like protein 1-like [Capsicum annuum]
MAIYIKAFVLLPLLFVSSYASNKHIDLGFDNTDDSSLGVNVDVSLEAILKFIDGKNNQKKTKKKNMKHELIFPDPFPIPREQENQEEEAPLDPPIIGVYNPKPDFETENRGAWIIHSQNAGVAAMHIQLIPNNKAIWFDTTNLGPSAIQNNPLFCKPVSDRPGETDCWSHGVQYDVESGQVRTLKVC